jgi:hypothetical protein
MGGLGNFTNGGRLSIRMALQGWSEKRNYKLEPDCFRQGRSIMSSRYDLPIKHDCAGQNFPIARK